MAAAGQRRRAIAARRVAERQHIAAVRPQAAGRLTELALQEESVRRSLRVRPAEPARQVRQELREPRARRALRGPARRRSATFSVAQLGIAWRHSISLVPGRLCEWIDCEPLPARKPLVLIVAYRCSFYGRSAGIALHNPGKRRGVGCESVRRTGALQADWSRQADSPRRSSVFERMVHASFSEGRASVPKRRVPDG